MGNMLSSELMPYLQYVDGFRIPKAISVEAFRSAIAYKPRPDDLFVVGYPRCGNAWTLYIVSSILRHGKPFTDAFDFYTQAPNLTIAGASAAHTMRRPGVINVHLPFHLTPINEKAKYIFVARNPKDCCVSYYYHLKSLAGDLVYQNFNAYFERFIGGQISFGDYFDTLISWYEHRNDPNVLFLTYEKMKEDTKTCILEIAGFVGDAYRKALEKDSDFLAQIMKYSSFSYMKESRNKYETEIIDMPRDVLLSTSNLSEGLKHWFSNPMFNRENSNHFRLVRKGIVGDWKNHFSEEQNRRLEEKFREITQGTDIPKLWEKYM